MTVYEMSVSASLLILAIVVIRALAIHQLPKATFLVLWGVAMCRLLIPFSVTSSFSLYAALDRLNHFRPELPSATVTSLQQVATLKPIANATEQAVDAATAAAVSINPVWMIWVTGVTVCALFFLITHFRFRRVYQTALPIDNRLIDEWLRSHKIRRPIQIRQLDRINAPLTYGILRPVILLPKATDWTDEKQLRYVLMHEFVHIKRFDTLWKWLLAASLCVHWFNPMVWVMYLLANRDIELSCDETVVRAFGAKQKSSYALTLINMEEKRSMYAPFCNNFSKNSIEERIKAIMKLKKISIVGTAAALVLVIGVSVAFATTGPHAKGITATATPVAQNASENQISGHGNLLKAEPKKDAFKEIDITDLNLNIDAKNISEAKNLTESITGDDFSSFVIKFQQDMDESTLNSQNILVFIGKKSTEFNYAYHAKSRKLNIDLKLDSEQKSQGGFTAAPVRILLTKKIKTSDGKFIDNDYVCLYRE
ncbi:M56 family metallopeptidase [Cohnella endophytica]|uniref:M56 family metallopeptidase n=1 Tax=Cohnella endophytica TaxID=2419778 RepID=A0A494XAP5_9BACL|nr:M56 family metallopeptidase [Cohnella endophytica]RKP47887.1 M56 family metallopeptidase [Cohnella endophytica]